MNAIAREFLLDNKHFAVAGASTNRSKVGNQVLRWYQNNNLQVTPINPREPNVEGLTSITSVSELPDPKNTGLSIITPPSITLKTLQDAHAAGIKYVWLQPGTDDQEVLEYAKNAGFKFVSGGPCILQIGTGLLQQGSRL
ncbi:hypothetical protein NQZ79_g2833 [Umbelopsis isabellina]|nr:hypothetical protein NQZ79_g2833 [Umbelopsis isabellina]